jgi:hypothetical protein
MTDIVHKVLRGLSNWNIGVVEGQVEDLLQDGSGYITDDPLENINWFPSQSSRFLADPFPVQIDGDTYIFFEELPYSTHKGRISYTKYPDWFENGRFEIAHEEPYHMTYPYMLKHDENLYCIPETIEANKVNIYRVDSPSKWTLEYEILTGIEVVDPTIFKYEGKWWMFHTRAPRSNSELYISYSDSLFDDWEEHDQNPVKIDPRSARSAGEFVMHGDKIYRPSQYCETEYGEKITINKIVNLTEEKFSEEKICEIKTSGTSIYSHGCHTLSSEKNVVCIDGKRRLRNYYWLKRRSKQIPLYLLRPLYNRFKHE